MVDLSSMQSSSSAVYSPLLHNIFLEMALHRDPDSDFEGGLRRRVI
jgi:hypothetical protein